jgi:hypothetical protein
MPFGSRRKLIQGLGANIKAIHGTQGGKGPTTVEYSPSLGRMVSWPWSSLWGAHHCLEELRAALTGLF